MIERAASGSSRDAEVALCNHRPVNRAVRANKHFSCADQTSFYRDAVFEHQVLRALDAAANPRPRANVQIAPDHHAAAEDLASLNLEVTVM